MEIDKDLTNHPIDNRENRGQGAGRREGVSWFTPPRSGQKVTRCGTQQGDEGTLTSFPSPFPSCFAEWAPSLLSRASGDRYEVVRFTFQ